MNLEQINEFKEFHSSKNMSYSLTLFQISNFRLFQTDRVCRRQLQNWMKMAENSQNG